MFEYILFLSAAVTTALAKYTYKLLFVSVLLAYRPAQYSL